jgi:hypothetical protein
MQLLVQRLRALILQARPVGQPEGAAEGLKPPAVRDRASGAVRSRGSGSIRSFCHESRRTCYLCAVCGFGRAHLFCNDLKFQSEFLCGEDRLGPRWGEGNSPSEHQGMGEGVRTQQYRR